MNNYTIDQSLLDGEDLREARINARAGLYIRGAISLDEFYEMEKAENDDPKVKRQKTFDRILEEIRRDKEQEDPEAFEDQEDPVSGITKDEFNALSLYEQTKLYEEHPDEIRKLLEPVKETKLTRDEFQKKSLQDQSKYFKAKPEEIRALLEGTVDSVDVGDLV